MNRRTLTLTVSLAVAMLAGAVPGAAASPQAAPKLNAPNVVGPFGAQPRGPFDRATAERKLAEDLAALAAQQKASGIKIPAVTRQMRAAGTAASALHRSLTASQKAQMRKLLERSAARMDQLIGRELNTAANPRARGRSPENVRDFAANVAKLSASLDRGARNILRGRQLALYRTSTRAQATIAGAAEAARTSVADAATSPQLSSSCYYGAYYELLALYYKYYGYTYAYYNYVTYGGTYAYYGYIYGYYAYNYGLAASPLLSQAYFEYLTVGRDWRGIGDDGVNYAYYDQYYAYYSYLYSYYSYLYEGKHTYAYYAYLYEYYAKTYGYYGYYYGNSYCQ